MSYRVFFIPKGRRTIQLPGDNDLVNSLHLIISHITAKKWQDIDFLANFENACKRFKFKFDADVKARVICAPDDDLKAKQTAIAERLHAIPVSQYAHGFVRNRDPYTCALAHTQYWGEAAKSLVILNADAKDFFHSISSSLVSSALRAHGFKGAEIQNIISVCMIKPDVFLAVKVLKAFCSLFSSRIGTSIVNDLMNTMQEQHCDEEYLRVLQRMSFILCSIMLSTGPGVQFRSRFLPQGSPASPVISNIVLKIVDLRIAALASKNGAFYTRYADDFTFTWHKPKDGKVSRKTINLVYWAAGKILEEYKIEFNRSKKRIMGTNVRQDIVGYCVNSGTPTISNQKRKRIRAIAHNELVYGSKRLRNEQRIARPDEDYGSKRNRQRDLRNIGLISQMAHAHPDEARKYMNQLKTAIERPFVTYGSGEEIEVFT